MASRIAEDTALVTGASSGIGRATAQALAAAGVGKMVLAARRIELLESLKEELAATCPGTQVHVTGLDVADLAAVARLPADLPGDFKEVTILINNAGLAAGFGNVASYNMDDLSAMMDVNVKGLAACCRAILPGMLLRKRGHVINISSIAGKAAYPGGAFYCASKAAVEAISTSLRSELVSSPLKVTTVSPGWVNEGTEFSKVRFGGDSQRAAAIYQGVDALTADDVADAIVYAATRPPHVQIADVYMLPTCQAHPYDGGLFRAPPPQARL